MNLSTIRKNLILKKWLLYMDFTASWLAYKPIEKKIQKILLTYANTHSEVWYNAELTTKYYKNAREKLYHLLEVNKEDFCIIPTGTWATWAIKRFQEIIWIYIPPSTRKRYNINPSNVPLVVIGPFEHHSNEISFREWLCEVIRCPLNEEWFIDLKELENILEKNKKREIIWSFSAASNVTWIKNPIEKIYKIIKKYNGIMCVDAAACSPYMNINCKYYDAMFLSPHKLIWGPWSCWLLVIKRSLCQKINKPTFAWWWTVKYVSRISHIYSDSIEERETAWTPWILQLIRASLAYELRNKIWLDFIAKREEMLKNYFVKLVKNIPNIKFYCNLTDNKIPIYSFNIIWVSPYLVAKILSDKYGIQTRAWCSCAWPYWHDLLWLKDNIDYDPNIKKNFWWVRISLHYTHTKKDIKFFVNALKEIVQKLTK